MIITAEISYYPLTEDYSIPINTFIQKLSMDDVSVEIGTMSTVLTGEYEKVMNSLSVSMRELMDEYPSVFSMKISNTCPLKCES
jgi:uncharacterized protein YqgV (UPF0045/DUF77 family)